MKKGCRQAGRRERGRKEREGRREREEGEEGREREREGKERGREGRATKCSLKHTVYVILEQIYRINRAIMKG